MVRGTHQHRPGTPGWQRPLGAALLLAFTPFLISAASTSTKGESTNTILSKAGRDGRAYIFYAGDDGMTSMNASGADLSQVRELRGNESKELLWFRRDDRTWIVRDAGLLAEVHKLLDHQIKVEMRQGATGVKQGDVGLQQAELGERQAELGRQKTILKAEVSKRDKSGQKADDLREQQRNLEEKERALGKQQAELGQQQIAIGKQQTELGGEQAKLAERNYKELGKLVGEAMRKGLAQEVKR